MKEVEVRTAEQMLKEFRDGYKELYLVYGKFKCPIRILNADEENEIILDAQKMKVPNEETRKQYAALETMKSILVKAAAVGSTPGLTRKFLNMLSSSEIEVLYDQYLEKAHQVNPAFEDLTPTQVATLISAVKKNPAESKKLSIIQLKAIGLYFLDEILPMAKEPGSK